MAKAVAGTNPELTANCTYALQCGSLLLWCMFGARFLFILPEQPITCACTPHPFSFDGRFKPLGVTGSTFTAMGKRRPLPKDFGVTLEDGAACWRLYSLRSHKLKNAPDQVQDRTG